MELGTLQDHLRSDKGCDNVKVRCTNSECRVKMERCCLAQHMENECVYRQYECEYCGHVDTFKAIMMGDIWMMMMIWYTTVTTLCVTTIR